MKQKKAMKIEIFECTTFKTINFPVFLRTPSLGKSGQNYKNWIYENVQPNLVLALLFLHTEVGCGKVQLEMAIAALFNTTSITHHSSQL